MTRDTASFRDDRLFILACDDTYAPKQYFDFFRLPRIQVVVVPTTDGSSCSKHVLDRLLEIDHEEHDERWLILDVDHNTQPQHIATFTATLARARQCSVNVALSRPCFEIWLLLHHLEAAKVEIIGNATQADQHLRDCLGSYNKTRLRDKDFQLSMVVSAVLAAEELDSRVAGGDVPVGTTTRIYKIWRSIVQQANPLQLPVEIRSLLRAP